MYINCSHQETRFLKKTDTLEVFQFKHFPLFSCRFFFSAIDIRYLPALVLGLNERGLKTMALEDLHLDGKAIWLANMLFEHCIEPDGGKRLRETGSIAPASSLKHGACRKAFKWCESVPKKRFFTMPSLRLAISRLLTRENLTIPFVSGLPFELWLERQSKHILHLCQRSRKNCSAQYRFQSYRQKSWTMDWADTVPMEAGINGITGNSR